MIPIEGPPVIQGVYRPNVTIADMHRQESEKHDAAQTDEEDSLEEEGEEPPTYYLENAPGMMPLDDYDQVASDDSHDQPESATTGSDESGNSGEVSEPGINLATTATLFMLVVPGEAEDAAGEVLSAVALRSAAPSTATH